MGDAYAKADELYDQAVRLTHVGTAAEAEAAVTAAVSMYREILDRTAAIEARRRLAKALWRQALLRTKAGNPDGAIEVGLHGIRLGRETIDATAREHPAFDAIVGEVATALNDLAQAAGQAGRLELYRELLEGAAQTCTRSDGPAARQALGTSLHNIANWALELLRAPGLVDPKSAPGYFELALARVKDALSVRESLLRSSEDPIRRWELASSLALQGELQCLGGDTNGLQTLKRAREMLTGRPESHAFGDLIAKISGKLALMTQLVEQMAGGRPPAAAGSRSCPCGSGLLFTECHGSQTDSR